MSARPNEAGFEEIGAGKGRAGRNTDLSNSMSAKAYVYRNESVQLRYSAASGRCPSTCTDLFCRLENRDDVTTNVLVML